MKKSLFFNQKTWQKGDETVALVTLKFQLADFNGAAHAQFFLQCDEQRFFAFRVHVESAHNRDRFTGAAGLFEPDPIGR